MPDRSGRFVVARARWHDTAETLRHLLIGGVVCVLRVARGGIGPRLGTSLAALQENRPGPGSRCRAARQNKDATGGGDLGVGWIRALHGTQNKNAPCGAFQSPGGEGGIRTHECLLDITGIPVQRLRPLGHLSGRGAKGTRPPRDGLVHPRRSGVAHWCRTGRHVAASHARVGDAMNTPSWPSVTPLDVGRLNM
jgi:hypothetical protein